MSWCMQIFRGGSQKLVLKEIYEVCQPSQKTYGHCVVWMGVAMHIMNGVWSEMCVGNGGHQVQDGGLLSPSCPFHVERHYHETY